MDNTNVQQEKTSEKVVTCIRNEKGQIISGTANPAGRPVGTRNFSTLFKEALKQIGETKGRTADEIEDDLVKRGILEALNGDFYFWNSVMDRNHGKPATKISFDDNVESIEVKIINSYNETKDEGDESPSENE